ncbi:MULTISPECIES: hypothetical protein [unclassified Mesorhizobium]|uniref:hypothetical protein n=1 Tax=unclassified Mesorhizobium TaxID=325217 RepID=UPI001125C517|nr:MULTISPECIES: hypothetical protein [unclassified Mesorhizobium]MBZ9704091.1 hypothetical protein [Mesorhizobium sp. CO1-1-3]MBZ9950293.1 hypothetical protein [Mesorhizobium sp. BR1-1-11]TPI98083.1 hypothetical protein FJ428_25555 [Mesorhizobium sp. B2-8-1]TPM47456.1 hypothetical protein FJ951_13940 [Mesorhizobium sp. B2-2-3]
MTSSKTSGFWTATYIGTVLLGVTFCAVYISLEDSVYYWDFAAYFNTFNREGALLVKSPLEWLSHLGASIETDDYSTAILVPLMPFHLLFGGSRFSYLAGVVTVYLVPTALFIGRMSYLEAVSETSSSRSWFAVWIAVFLYTPFWAATLRGLPDIAGCFALAAASWFLWRSKFLTREPVISAISVGACLWLAFMLRRWYAYGAIGIALSAALFCVLQVAKDCDLPALRKAVLGGMCAIAVILGSAWNFQLPLIAKILRTSYGDLYSGYRTDLLTQLGEMSSRLSFVNWLLILLGLYFSVVRGNRFALFCALASVLTFFLFTRTQDPDRHHSMPMFLWFFPAYAQAIVAIVSMPALRSRWSTAVIAIAAGLAFVGTFFPIGRELLSPVSIVFAKEATLPLHLDNLPEYRRLIADLMRNMEPENRVSVFASGPVMSDSLLFGMNRGLFPYVVWTCQVDSRDRFVPEVLKSRYVVVTDRPVTHLQSGAQLCVTIPNQHIFEGTGIGAAYKRIDIYRLSGGVTGYLYEQVRPVSKSELDALYSEFRKKYPGWTTPQW